MIMTMNNYRTPTAAELVEKAEINNAEEEAYNENVIYVLGIDDCSGMCLPDMGLSEDYFSSFSGGSCDGDVN